jgi:hypothetical protein
VIDGLISGFRLAHSGEFRLRSTADDDGRAVTTRKGCPRVHIHDSRRARTQAVPDASDSAGGLHGHIPRMGRAVLRPVQHAVEGSGESVVLPSRRGRSACPSPVSRRQAT